MPNIRLPLLLATLFPLLLAAGCSSRPEDQVILEFRNARAQYDQLVDMYSQNPGLGRVAMEYTLPTNPADVDVSFDRIKEYRALCTQLKAMGCLEAYDEDNTYIWVHREEHPQSFVGTKSGFLYADDPPFPVVEDLGTVKLDTAGVWLKHIDGPWYYYLEYRP